MFVYNKEKLFHSKIEMIAHSVNNIICTIINLNNKSLYFKTILFLLLRRRTDVLQMGWDMLNRTYTSSAYERRMKVAFICHVAPNSLSSAVEVAYFPLSFFFDVVATFARPCERENTVLPISCIW